MLTAHFTGTQGTPDSTTSYFMGGQYELKDGTTKKYYSIAGMMVAVNDGTGLQYLLTDHLGSTVAVTNSSGTLTSQQRYLPFGGVRSIPNFPILVTDFGYTGQRMLDSGMGGIMDYRARFYSPALMRFLQADTVIPGADNPQSWNRYSYVHNNPVKYNDPSGHWLETAWDIANIVWDIAEVRKDPSALNIGALVLDVAAVLLPAVPAGAGLLVRGTKVASKIDDAGDALKIVKKVPIVIGETVERVEAYAKLIGGKAYNPRKIVPYIDSIHDAISLKLNKRWINDMMREGREIIDIGPDFAKRMEKYLETGEYWASKWYQTERAELARKAYSNYQKVFERLNKLEGGVPGFDP